MSQSDKHETLDFTLLKIGIDKILNSVGKSALREISRTPGNHSLDKNYYYRHPDVLCTILRMKYGKSYIKMIKSI
jgi:hypothetical protein